MRVVICHNCSGFGVTVGPVIETAYDERDIYVMADDRRSDKVYPCQCCGGAGYLQVVAPA